MIDTGRADLIHDFDNAAIFGARVTLDVNDLVKTRGEMILDQPADIFLLYARVAQVDVAVAGDGDDSCRLTGQRIRAVVDREIDLGLIAVERGS